MGVLLRTMKLSELSNDLIQQELGQRLQHERLNQNVSQSQLASRAGIARRTLVAAEAGEGMGLSTFIAIMRELGLIDRLDQMVPEPTPSPIHLSQLQGKPRRRASRPRKTSIEEKTRGFVINEPTAWKWKE